MAEITDITAARRRTLLRAVPLAVAGGLATRSGEAAAKPDADLIELAQRLHADWAAVDGVCDRLAEAEAAGDVAGQAAADADFKALFARIEAAEEGIADMPAHGAAGLAVKAALLCRIYLGPSVPEDRHDRLARTLAADARRLVPCALEVEA
jgi:hypothetical protein